MKKIVLFGDSLFNGFRQHRNTDAITHGLQKRLGKFAIVENMSKSGATTIEALDYLDQIDPNADIIIIEYGTNDSSAWGISCENYAKNLETIVNYFNPNKLIIVSPWHPNPNSEQTEFFNPQILKENVEIAQKLAKKYNCPIINLNKLTDGIKNVDKIYQSDGLHLTDLGNKCLLDLITPVIETKLKG
ncbi:MAG: SGNH/GDSL hydrolase family protein [Lactobacillus sp.]|nr:SGNH/GDSL hydrolase family protein [Lactobacillus sp.]